MRRERPDLRVRVLRIADPQSRRVVSGEILGDEVLVYEGLAAGDRVAASGSFKLREGVRVVDAGAGKDAK